jgi:hypothetical protein
MRLPASVLSRRGLGRTLVAIAAGAIPALQSPLAAHALTYTIVPTGSIADKELRLTEVNKEYEKTPDDPYVFGEKAQIE